MRTVLVLAALLALTPLVAAAPALPSVPVTAPANTCIIVDPLQPVCDAFLFVEGTVLATECALAERAHLSRYCIVLL